MNPEPVPQNLDTSRNVMLTGEYDLAICNDGDADRAGILDEHGDFVPLRKVLSLLALNLVREKQMRGEIVKTFSTTRLKAVRCRSCGHRCKILDGLTGICKVGYHEDGSLHSWSILLPCFPSSRRSRRPGTRGRSMLQPPRA